MLNDFTLGRAKSGDHTDTISHIAHIWRDIGQSGLGQVAVLYTANGTDEVVEFRRDVVKHHIVVGANSRNAALGIKIVEIEVQRVGFAVDALVAEDLEMLVVVVVVAEVVVDAVELL